MICNLRSTAAMAIGFARNISKSMPDVNCSIIAIASTISLNQRCGGVLKDKNRLALGSFQYFGSQHFSVAQVRLYAEDIRQAVFQVDPPYEGLLPVLVEIGNYVYV